MYLGSVLMMSDANTGSSPTYEFQTDYWTPENTDAKFPRLLSSTGNNGSNNTVGSDFWLINGGYLRMRDIQVGYDFAYTIEEDPVDHLVECGFERTKYFYYFGGNKVRN